MTDIVSKKVRSRMMSDIRGENTSPELLVRRFLHKAGLRYRLHSKKLPGRPDIVLSARRAVVFVHGCFWHRHAGCGFAYMPKSNTVFWSKKFSANVERDQRVKAQLQSDGWRVLVVWECKINERTLKVLANRLGRMKAVIGST